VQASRTNIAGSAVLEPTADNDHDLVDPSIPDCEQEIRSAPVRSARPAQLACGPATGARREIDPVAGHPEPARVAAVVSTQRREAGT
jgi:hypothetical protein